MNTDPALNGRSSLRAADDHKEEIDMSCGCSPGDGGDEGYRVSGETREERRRRRINSVLICLAVLVGVALLVFVGPAALGWYAIGAFVVGAVAERVRG